MGMESQHKKWAEEGKIEVPVYLTVGQFDWIELYHQDVEINWDKQPVPDELWNVIEKYAGLWGVEYQPDGNSCRKYLYDLTSNRFNYEDMTTHSIAVPAFVPIPIDLAIKVCDECDDEDGGDVLRKCKEEYGDSNALLRVFVDWDLDNEYSDIHFSDGSNLEDYT